MTWQQQRKGRGEEEKEISTVLGKVSTSLDAVSYIVAFFLVDALTFGSLPTSPNSPTNESSPSQQQTTSMGYTSRTPSSSSLPRRSASEGDEKRSMKTSKSDEKQKLHSNRLNNSSESSLYDWKQSNAGTEKTSPRLSPTIAYNDRSLHHYQKKLFGKQVREKAPFACIVVMQYAY